MRIGKQDNAVTSICTSDATSITVRGLDLCNEVIGHVDFTSYFWLLVTGTMPTPSQKALADAVLCAIAEHGLVPSVVATRMTYAAAPEAFHGAVAAGLLGCGSVVLGSAEVAGKFYAQVVADANGSDPASTAIAAIKALRAEKKAIPGFGHPQHSGGDPRAHRLLALAKEHGMEGEHIAMLRTIESVLPEAIALEAREAMEGVVTEGTGRKAQSERYRMFGKSGTAQVFSVKLDLHHLSGQIKPDTRRLAIRPRGF